MVVEGISIVTGPGSNLDFSLEFSNGLQVGSTYYLADAATIVADFAVGCDRYES
jgi:hypothetical protein